MLGVGEAPGCEGRYRSLIESHNPNLNAEGEDDSALSLQVVIAGHWKAYGVFCSPLELGHSFTWAERRLVFTEARKVAQIRNSQVFKIC